MKPEEVKAKEETAKKIKKELDGGKEFSTAVKEYTEDKAALASGGDMILIKGIAPKALDQQAFSLPVGEVSAPIKRTWVSTSLKLKKNAPKNKSVMTILSGIWPNTWPNKKSKPRWPLISANCTIKQT